MECIKFCNYQFVPTLFLAVCGPNENSAVLQQLSPTDPAPPWTILATLPPQSISQTSFWFSKGRSMVMWHMINWLTGSKEVKQSNCSSTQDTIKKSTAGTWCVTHIKIPLLLQSVVHENGGRCKFNTWTSREVGYCKRSTFRSSSCSIVTSDVQYKNLLVNSFTSTFHTSMYYVNVVNILRARIVTTVEPCF